MTTTAPWPALSVRRDRFTEPDRPDCTLTCPDHGDFAEVTVATLADEPALRAVISAHVDAEHPDNTDGGGDQ